MTDSNETPSPVVEDRQPHLMKQDAKNVQADKLTALTPEVVSLRAALLYYGPALSVLSRAS